MSNKSGVAKQVISLPTGGGALHGIGETFKPDLFTGTGNLSIPIQLPAGRNGFQPQLNLVYSTGSGNGPFGLGWGVDVPSVSRKTAKGVPRYLDRSDVPLEERDTFVLSSSEDLVQVTESDGSGVAQFVPRTEGLFAEITRIRSGDDIDFWQVRSKDGLVSLYGTPADSDSEMDGDRRRVIANPRTSRKIFLWALSETRDTFGNRIEYSYFRDRRQSSREGPPEPEWDQLYLRRIRYVDTENGEFLISVDFVYDEAERKDAFSMYRAGFEVRTRFRCRRIEISTHAAGRALLRTYQLAYLDDARSDAELPRNRVSLLTGISLIGHDGDMSQAMPPLEFGYTALDFENRQFQPLSTAGLPLPEDSLAADDYELVDLFGKGLPDVIEVKDPIRFWRNAGVGRFEEPRTMVAPPIGVRLSNPGTLFADLNGNARADLLAFEASGFFPLTFSGQFSEQGFVQYGSIPTLHLEDGNTRFLDLDGDSVTDALLTGESSLFLFFNDPVKGWHRTEERPRASFDAFPNVSFKNDQVKLGDLSGDGLQDIAFVENGTIHYWPYLGDGRWARRIETKFAPAISDPSAPAGLGFDPRRIHFSDVDGDGLDDLIYVQSEKITIWINQSGSGWSKPKVIKHDLLFDNPEKEADAVRVVDMRGTGTAGILWTFERRPDAQENFQFLDLTGGVKPYLLDVIDNHMGATTRIRYAPSTRFYLADRQASQRGDDGATPWKTPLPFPVQVVERVEIIDELSKSKLTSEYRYHHGYWDGNEREFRGFGMVEQLDTELRTDFNAVGLHGDAHDFDRLSEPQFSPPVLRKTWFHLGDIDDETLEDQGKLPEVDFSEEYFQGDPPLLVRPEEQIAVLERLPDHSARREALRTLRGTTLRTEMWAPAEGARPFTVTETLMGLREVEADLPKRRRVFFPHPLAQRTTKWEGGNDPMTSFTFTDDYDYFGQPRRQTQIDCPRAWRRLEDTAAESYLVTHHRTAFAKPAKPDLYIVDRVAHSTSFEIVNDGSQTVTALKRAADSGSALRVIDQSVNFYDGPAFIGLPNGQIGEHGVLVRTENLIMTEEILTAAYRGSARDADDPEIPPYLVHDGPPAWTSEYPLEFRAHIESLPHLAGFTFYAADDVRHQGYFATHARNAFDFQLIEPIPSTPRGLLRIVRDPLGRETAPGEPGSHDTTIGYDDFDLLPIRVTEPEGLVTQASYDLRLLRLAEVTDPNGNRTHYTYTPLGLLKDTSVLGKVGEVAGDEMLLADGATARVPSVRFEYDFLALQNSPRAARTPISVRTIRRLHHVGEIGVEDPDERERVIEMVEYSDGFGRLLQTRALAEDETVGDSVFGQGVLPLDQSVDPDDIVLRSRAPGAAVNVVVTGAQRYDNKGRVTEKFEPYFELEGGLGYRRPGKAQLGRKITLFYDALGRLIRTLNADGSEQRVVHGVPGSIRNPDLTTPDSFEPTPWETFTYDGNDLAPLSHEPSTADGEGPPLTGRAPRHHHFTPSSIVVDARGRTIRSLVRNRELPENDNAPLPAIHVIETNITYDVRGNVFAVVDALNRNAFRYVHNLANDILRTETLDSGVRRIVVDAAGNEVERRNSKGTVILQAYDPLRRRTRLWARDQSGSSEGIQEELTLRERLEYGDAGDRDRSRTLNRLGALHKHYDEAGLLEVSAYDFKGNILEKSRRVIRPGAVTALSSRPEPGENGHLRTFRVDWDPVEEQERALLGDQVYETSAEFDALNRVTKLVYPRNVNGHRQVLELGYNRAGMLEQLALDGEPFVEHIAYDAKRQKTFVAFGNGVMTLCAYEPRTLRLARIFSSRFSFKDGRVRLLTLTSPEARRENLHQDIAYEYDLSGNLTRIHDRTPDSGIPNNRAGRNAFDRVFEYDAISRLVSATGREVDTAPEDGPHEPFDPRPRGTDFSKARRYRERYVYDAIGNLLELDHAATDESRRHGFIRRFEHRGTTNQLAAATTGGITFTYLQDDNGNTIRETTTRHFEWDHSDRLSAFRVQAGAEPSLHTHYLYDAGGQRVQKVIRKQGGGLEFTVYVEGIFEHTGVLRKGDEPRANNVVHVMDGELRLASVRIGASVADEGGPAIQYTLADHIGSSNVVLGPDGKFVNREEYTPYGTTSFGSFRRKRFRFTGMERDEESGLSSHGARYFAPWLGRWMTADPRGAAMPNWSPFCYGFASPLQFIDPSGEEPEETPRQEQRDNPEVAQGHRSLSTGYEKTSGHALALEALEEQVEFACSPPTRRCNNAIYMREHFRKTGELDPMASPEGGASAVNSTGLVAVSVALCAQNFPACAASVLVAGASSQGGFEGCGAVAGIGAGIAAGGVAGLRHAIPKPTAPATFGAGSGAAKPWTTLVSGYEAMSGTRAGIVVSPVRFGAYQNLAAGSLGGAIAAVETESHIAIATSTGRNRALADQMVRLSMLGLKNPPKWYGSCGEIGCLNLLRGYGIETRGAISRAFNIAGAAKGKGHLTPKVTCEGCKWVLPQHGVRTN